MWGPVQFLRRWWAERLARQGYERLAAGDREGALAVARRLQGGKYPFCYEYLADIHLSQFDFAAAIAVLREAVDLFPDDHAMRLRLAAALSDAGEYDEAVSHILGAKALPGADADRLSLDFNLAVVLRRKDDLDGALEINRRLIADPALSRQTAGLRCFIHAQHVSLLALHGDVEAALSFHAANVGRLDMTADEPREQQAEVWESYASALVDAGRFADAEAAVRNGLERDATHADLFGVWRRMHGGAPDVERDYMQVYVANSEIRAGIPHTTCLVAADDVEDALDHIREFMPAPLRDSLFAWHVQHYERRPMSKGIYAMKPLPP